MMSEVYGRRVGRKDKAALAAKTWIDVKPTADDPKWRSLAERVAQHRVYERNKHIGFLKEAFPNRPMLWTTDLYFHYAQGGALFIDEPVFPSDLAESEQKANVMERFGLRFLIIKPKMKYEDCMLALLDTDARLKNGMVKS